MVLKAVQTPTVQEAVYTELYQAIVSGKIPPGKRITMRKLADDLGVSVMPVREALRRLEARNFITIKSNKQIVVSELSPDHFRQIFEARLLLEGHAAKKAAAVRSNESLSALEDSMKAMQTAADEDSLFQANRRFHSIIYDEANLPVFIEIIDNLWERVSPYFYIIRKDEQYWTEKTFMQNHEGMLKGMRAKNPDEVYQWLRDDLTGAADVFFKVFERGQIDR